MIMAEWLVTVLADLGPLGNNKLSQGSKELGQLFAVDLIF